MSKHKYALRLAMVKYARTHGIRAASRHYDCSRNTIRLWLRRYEEKGARGLEDRSRAPKTCPHKTSPYHERCVLEARRKAPCFGALRLKDEFGLKPSVGAIGRILQQAGKTRKRHKKSQKKNDLRQIKMQYHAFERLQADTKPLYDIAAYWPQMQALGLPRQQYTHRDVKSGALFIDYADELSTTYATLSLRRDFFEKITTYQNWWNFARKNYSKDKRTPAEILEEEGINPLILMRNPEDLDALLRKGVKIRGVGQNLPVDTALLQVRQQSKIFLRCCEAGMRSTLKRAWVLVCRTLSPPTEVGGKRGAC
jgi:transposase